MNDMTYIPKTVTVKDAGVSVQEIREMCSEGKLNATPTMPGSGRW